MDFSLNDEQVQIRDLANKILQEQVTDQRLRELDQAEPGQRFDRDLWGQLAGAGLLGIAIDEEYGGMGFGFFELSLLLEEIGRVVAAVPAISCLGAAAAVVQKYGSEQQKQALLPGVASGELLLTAAVSEKLSVDPLSPQTAIATESGDGYQLSGNKHYVAYAADCHRMVVSAKSPNGNVLLLVDPAQQGVHLDPVISTTREPQYIVGFDNVVVAGDDVLVVDSNEDALPYLVAINSIACCAVQLGVTDAATRLTAKYTGERKQFNVQISTFQAVAHRAANAYIDVECLRLCTQQAASLVDDLGERVTMNELVNAASMTKVWAGDAGHRVSYSAQQLHGGTGVDRDYPLWRYCMMMRQLEFAMGSSQQHLNQLGKRAATGQLMMA